MVGSLGTIGISLFAPFASLETSIFGYEADHFVKEIMQDYAYFINWLSIPNFSGGLSFLNMFLFYLFILKMDSHMNFTNFSGASVGRNK